VLIFQKRQRCKVGHHQRDKENRRPVEHDRLFSIRIAEAKTAGENRAG
jgi:hypothetical protein